MYYATSHFSVIVSGKAIYAIIKKKKKEFSWDITDHSKIVFKN